MQKHIYEYAVIRIVPKVEREEFINAGVILFCKKKKFIKIKYSVPAEKISIIAPDADIDEITENLIAFYKIAAGKKDGGPIAMLDEAERFRWLTAVRSASIQTSRPHPGLTDDPEKALDNLFAEMVG